MKITTRSTSFVIAITLTYAVLLIITIISLLGGEKMSVPFILLSEAAYITPVIYLTVILGYLRESNSIKIGYWVYIIYDLALGTYYLLLKPADYTISVYFYSRLITIIIVIILITQSFRIKNIIFTYPFCLYWFFLLFVLFIKTVGWFMLISRWTTQVYRFSIISEILLPLSMLYILFKTLKYLTNEKTPASLLLQTENDQEEY